MPLLLTFGCALLVAVLVSERAERTVLSSAVLFLATGLVYGMLRGPPEERVVQAVAEFALIVVLVTDASRASVHDLRRAWRLPGRALLLGFPGTVAITAGLAVPLLNLSWTEALLVGSVLAPTDPVLSSAIIGAEGVPASVRRLLNVESGVNDGLALPFVMALLAMASHGDVSAPRLGLELVGGIAIGVAVPWLTIRLARTRAFGATEAYLRLGTLAAAIVVYALCSLVHANPFLGAFAAGVTIGTSSPAAREAFHPLGESLGELLKLGALFLFGALLTLGFVADVGVGGWLLAVLAIAVARPLAIGLALLGSDLSWRDRLVAGWFGPKGFSSVVYGLLVAHASLPHRDVVVHAIGAAIVLSVVAHSSSDVPVAQRLSRRDAAQRASSPILDAREGRRP